MGNASLLLYYLTHRRFPPSFRSFFFIPTCLALFTSILILFHISTTSNLFFSHQQPSILRLSKPLPLQSSSITQNNLPIPLNINNTEYPFSQASKIVRFAAGGNRNVGGQQSSRTPLGSDGMSI